MMEVFIRYIFFFMIALTIFFIVEISPYQAESSNIQPDKLCGCHDGIVAPYVITHSNITSNYGEWSIKCYTCHTIHHNEQVINYGNESYVFEGTSTNVTSTTLSKANAGWTVDQYRGYTLIANTSVNSSLYKIIGNTADTLNIGEPLNLKEVKAGDTFAIIYRKMIRTTIITPNNGTKSVKFFNPEGMRSFADGDTTYDGICEVCHSKTAHFRNDGSAPDQNHTSMGEVVGTKCTKCHRHINGFKGMGGGAHDAHITADYGPKISCSTCHGAQSPPLLADGQDLKNTTVCNTCHSPNGSYDGVNDMNTGARNNWAGVYNTTDNTLKAGKEKWCIGCHDDAPAVVNGETASNKAGDNITYGYYVTGHGRDINFSRMSWQDMNATGNPGANQGCDRCHNANSNHIIAGVNPGSHRLKDSYGNNQNNSNCNNCHPPGTSAISGPQFYTNSSEFESSVHGGKNCTDCHEVHGSSGAYRAMTRGNKQDLCNQCHGNHAGHALGVSFGKGGKRYALECISCHNVHIITGNVSLNKSPITLFSNNTRVWGDESGEKMNSYVGSGTYRTPDGDSLAGSQLPDYITFCLDCHSVSRSEFGDRGEISWGGNEPHGLNSANVPNGGGKCPDWFACGQAEGWDGDRCVGDNSTCWPVIPRGKGEQIWSRGPYNQDERIAGSNFILSCSDCHVTHESGIGYKLRSKVNNGTGSTVWNTMCNNCHYYYSDWHAGMACGSASCHAGFFGREWMGSTNTIHGMSKNTGDGSTRTFNRDIVADMKFENNLTDSGSFRMHGRWFDTAGSYSTGKSGNAVVLNGNQPIELGTRDSYWSTDAGKHGTWVYSEMKNNMTLEAWVYPTGSQAGGENHIISKHTYTEGGYAFLLKSIGGTLRAALLTNVNGGEAVWNSVDCNGLRGAYSTVPIVLNQWTHIAAVFDSNLPDRNPNDLSVGRIRIYVNGEDVTTSYPNVNQCYAQPGTGENDIFPYSEMNIKNESRCYNGQWCASALSIGGVMWGNGSRKGLIGKIDDVKVWNIPKTSTYFKSFDQLSPPRLMNVEGATDRNWIVVTFSEGVYTNTDQSGNLQPDDFNLVDIDDSRTIISVNHNAGDSIATLTLSSPPDGSNDIDADTVAANSNSIYDEYNNPAETGPVTITGQKCPTGPTIFQLNETTDSITVADNEGIIKGKVNDPGQSFVGDGYFHGDGSNNYIDFENNTQCMQSSTSMTFETRIKPYVVDNGGSSTIQRVFARDGSGNYQISVWRNNDSITFPNYKPPNGVASIAFWVNPVNNHGGDAWKPVLTNYTYYPIMVNHWYKIKIIWNSGKIEGTPGDIFVDDQGTDGNGTDEYWAGYVNATDSDQLQLTPNKRLYEGDQIITADGQFIIGANINNHASNVFNGLIDWIIWKDSID